MACCVLQITGLIFGGVSMVGTLAATVMPQWRVSAYIDGNIVVFETIWEGLWMDCISQLGIRLQCKFYDSVLALPPPLEAFRALMCIAVVLSIISFLMAIVGVKYTHRTKEGPEVISIFILAAGVAFLLTGILVLIPVSWTGGSIIHDFYDPRVPMPLKRELGAALYVGWVSSALLIAAGAMYCSFWCWADTSSKFRYPSLSRHRLHKPDFAGGPSLSMHAYV
ncbi:PREDICTED: claudin-8-like [Buceros rhinoceros silvestris]|uniref:claudin-8-like n=1 Tax=Buceros rhinoceros silvestris TaxID=175836 RepID=UPI0005287922|nr:PREDICTED: claudin-8-like [Buceros rhinoceros silvestris]